MSISRPDGDPATPARRSLPRRPSLEQLHKEAKDLLRDARRGDAAALTRMAAVTRAAPRTRSVLADAQLTIAREYGFASWPKLVHHVELAAGRGFVLRPLIRPAELSPGRRWPLAGGADAATDDVFAMFVAARDGEITTVRRLVARTLALATVEYNYTPPIHFAVREGHRDIAELLLEHGADPTYRSYPFQESLLMFAEDRGHDETAELLRRRLSRRFPMTPKDRKSVV